MLVLISFSCIADRYTFYGLSHASKQKNNPIFLFCNSHNSLLLYKEFNAIYLWLNFQLLKEQKKLNLSGFDTVAVSVLIHIIIDRINS